jgi:hypothetical protein
VEFDRLGPAGVQCQERGRRRPSRVLVEPARDQYDAALEELFLQPAAEDSCLEHTARLHRCRKLSERAPRIAITVDRRRQRPDTLQVLPYLTYEAYER